MENDGNNADHDAAQDAAKDARAISTPWYRAPIVWFGIVLSLALVMGYSVLIYISHTQASHEKAGASIKPSEQLNQLFGVPFTRDQVKAAANTPASAPTSTPDTP